MSIALRENFRSVFYTPFYATEAGAGDPSEAISTWQERVNVLGGKAYQGRAGE